MSKPHFIDYEQNEFVQRHQDNIAGVVGCYDRLIFKGTLSSIGYDRAMEKHLCSIGVRLKDYTEWASSKRDEIKFNAERLASEAGIEIEHVRSTMSFRKEQRIKEIVAERAMRSDWCTCSRRWSRIIHFAGVITARRR